MDYRLVKIFHKDLNESQALELQNVNYDNILNVVHKKYSRAIDFVCNPLVILYEDKEIKDQKDLDAAFEDTLAQGKSHLELVAKFADNSKTGDQTATMSAEPRDGVWRSASVSLSSSSTEDSFEVLPHHHVDIRCYVCDSEIYGVRFQCMNCESDFNLCEDCEADIDGRHFPTHVFAKIRHPEATGNLTQIRKLAQGSTTSASTTVEIPVPVTKPELVDVATSPVFPLVPPVELHDVGTVCESLNSIRLVDCGCDAPARISQSDAGQQSDPCQHLSLRSCVTQTSIDATKDARKKLSCTKIQSQAVEAAIVLNETLAKQLDTVSFDWKLSGCQQGVVSYKEVVYQTWHLQCQGPIVWPQQCLQVIPLKQSASGNSGDVNTFLEAIQCWAKLRHRRSTGQLVCKTMISLSALTKAQVKIAVKTGQSALIHWHVCTNSWPPKPLAHRMTTKLYLKVQRDIEATALSDQKKKKQTLLCYECPSASSNGEMRPEVSGRQTPRLSLAESSSTLGNSLAPEIQEVLVTPMGSNTSLDAHMQNTSNNNPFDDLLLDSQPRCTVKTPIETQISKSPVHSLKNNGLGTISRSSSEEILPSFVQPRVLSRPDGTQTTEWVFVSPEKKSKPLNNEPGVTEQPFTFTQSPPAVEKPSNWQSASKDVPYTDPAPQCSLEVVPPIVEQPGTSSISSASEVTAAPRDCPETFQRWLQTENDAWIPATTYRGPPSSQPASVPVWLTPAVERACSGHDEAYLGAHQPSMWTSAERATGLPATPQQHSYQYESLTPMNQLMNMGFYNRELNQRLLNQHANDLQLVIEALLQMQ